MEEKFRRRIFPVIQRWGLRLVIICILVSILFSTVVTTRFMRETGISPVVILQLLFNDGLTLQSSGDRTNVLLLGISGGNHAGSDLTDTMIVVSFNNNTRTASLISIPRDIWSDTLKDKVNSAYHYGEEKKKGGGLVLAKVITEDVIGMSVHYAIAIDFSGFKNLIDLIGGIDVNITRGFTDPKFPIPGKEQDTCPGDPTNACVYETVRFEKGIEHMSGERALTYVRSRHAEGEEGGDFARSRRQQEVLLAFKDKIMHPLRWITPRRLWNIPKGLDDATDTDMNAGELLSVGKRYLKIKDADIKKVALDNLLTEGEPYLYNGLYVLVPKDDWVTLQKLIADAIQ